MPSRNRNNLSYKIITGVVILVCGFHLIFILPYFDSEDTDIKIFTKVKLDIQYIKTNVPMPASNDSGPILNYISLSWPRMKSMSLLRSLFDGQRYWWISERVQRLWPEFEQNALEIKGNCSESSKLKILILPGVLSFTNFASRGVVKNGGPLGELTQWADLIAGCLALCHYINVKTDFKSAEEYLKASANEATSNGCASNNIDLIFTDITGIKNLSPTIVKLYKNKFRIVDVYGTEASFNDPEYAENHNVVNRRWSMLDMHLKQFYTMFPHSPDNSFLGFVISSSNYMNRPKLNYTLIIGKEASYLKGKMKLLETISSFFPIAATISTRALNLLPKDSMLLGVVDPIQYVRLLSEAKVCLGLGDPIESPSPLLSLAAGCIFLNPRKNQTLYGKPTHRKVTSQSDFLLRYIGPPHVYTYNETDLDSLRLILQRIMTTKHVEPIIPKAFTVHGYLNRLENSLLFRNLCSSTNRTNTRSQLRTFLAKDSSDCKDICYKQGLICEPDYFVELNKLNYLRRSGLVCKDVIITRELYSPAYNRKLNKCYLQPQDNPLFSCVGGPIPGLQRVCPCTPDVYGEVVTYKKFKKLTYHVLPVP